LKNIKKYYKNFVKTGKFEKNKNMRKNEKKKNYESLKMRNTEK